MKFQLAIFHNRSFYNFVLDTLEANGYDVNPADKKQMGYFGQSYATLYMNTANKTVKVLHGNHGVHRTKAVEESWGESLKNYKRLETSFKVVEIENLDKKRFHRKDVGHVINVHGIKGYDLQFFTYGHYIHVWQTNWSFKQLGTANSMAGAIDGIKSIYKKKADAESKKNFAKLLERKVVQN